VSAQKLGLAIADQHPVHRTAVLFYDPFYSDAFYRGEPTVISQPPVIVLQASPPPAPVAEHPAAPTQPLMIELQDGHYVQVRGEETSRAELEIKMKMKPKPMDATTAPAPRRSAKPFDTATHSIDAPELAPAVLVFRDGHRQEISEYTIADGSLYTRGNYYIDGSWNKKIELSSLNLPDTIDANQSRGIKFQLPTAPNEVIVRP
jgi:hypothetical protein